MNSLSHLHSGDKTVLSRRFLSRRFCIGVRSRQGTSQRMHHAVFYAVGLLWLGQSTAPAQPPSRALPAQSGPVAPTLNPLAPVTPAAPALPPVVPGLNVLIIALDDVNPAPFSMGALLPLPAPASSVTAIAPLPPGTPPAVPPAPIAPSTVAPAPLNALPEPALAPMQWKPSGPKAQWQVLAQKKKKRDPEDNLFLPIPEPSNSTIGRKSRQEAAELAAAAAAQNPSRGTSRSLPVPPPTDSFTRPLSPQSMAPAVAAAPPGRSQQAATALRRALMARGYTDVLTTAPDGSSVVRAIGDRRLAPHVLEDLKRALGGLAMPGAVDQRALAASTKAAAHIGQTLGYQAVIALYVSPPVAQADGTTAKSAWNAVLVDSTRERGEPLLFDEGAAVANGNEIALLDAGAATGAALLDKSLQNWLPASATEKVSLANGHFEAARVAFAAGDMLLTQDELNQTLALDPSRGEAYVLLGDSLQNSDPQAASAAYKRAVDINARDGATWAKVTAAYANATPPDWPRALESGRKALATGYDTVELRVAMAAAQYGRAGLFRQAERLDRAEDAELEAKTHLDKALALAPDDPSAIRLLASTLMAQGRFNEATQTLDRIAPRFPNDVEIQTQYAKALGQQTGREEDAFVAFSRVWKQSGQKGVNVDAAVYRTLAQGFDLRLFNLGKVATQLSAGVATGAVAREAALLQLSKLKEDMNDAQTAINTVQAPLSVGGSAAASRIFAADLMNQALEAHQTYLETGQPLYRARGLELYRQAVARLNAARNAQ